jgi:dienelactone hydrolase
MTYFGNVGMAGNVREWVSNPSGESRFILGGAWDDPTYLFSQHYAESPWNRSSKNGLRLVRYLSEDGLDELRRPLEVPFRDYSLEQPVPDAVFEAFKGAYAYDPTDLNADTAAVDTTEAWIRERVTFEAAYGNERVIADLYLPRHRPPPHQTLVYFPGSNAVVDARTLDNLPGWSISQIDFLVRDGRAVMVPAYDGMYDRRDSTLVNSGPQNTNRYAEFVTHWVKDLGRSIDYLETRDDVISDNLGYFGCSFGGRMAPVMLAMEPRLKVAVLYLAGLYSERPLPAADVLNFLPRVRVPVLMINGRDDHRFPRVYQVPFFELLGTPEPDKDSLTFPGGHGVPHSDLVRETIRWLDKYLGPTGSS